MRIALACASMPALALPPDMASALKQAGVPADAVAVVVQEVGARQARLTLNPQRPMNPASVLKLVTTAAALDLLGPVYTWSTQVWLDGRVDAGVLDGPLVIRGSGDPKLVVERLWLLLRHVRSLGVRELRGGIVLDRTAFSVPVQSPAQFDGEPARPYNVASDALLVNFKSLMLTFTPDERRGVAWVWAEPPVAGVTVDPSVPLAEKPDGFGVPTCDDWRGGLRAELSDPARVRFRGAYPAACGEKTWPIAFAEPDSYNARAIEAMWRELGGTLGAPVRDGTAPLSKPAFEMPSAPLAEQVRDINKFSNNVMAQQLFLTLGAHLRGAGTAEAGRDVLNRWLDERFGHDASGAVIDNGSGLSRETRVSAQLLARLLLWVWEQPLMPELVSSLPAAGLDGTLTRSTAPVGRAHLKTGSLRDVAAIGGYVLALSGRRYVVVAIVNHANANRAEVRAGFDALVRWCVDDLVKSR